MEEVRNSVEVLLARLGQILVQWQQSHEPTTVTYDQATAILGELETVERFRIFLIRLAPNHGLFLVLIDVPHIYVAALVDRCEHSWVFRGPLHIVDVFLRWLEGVQRRWAQFRIPELDCPIQWCRQDQICHLSTLFMLRKAWVHIDGSDRGEVTKHGLLDVELGLWMQIALVKIKVLWANEELVCLVLWELHTVNRHSWLCLR